MINKARLSGRALLLLAAILVFGTHALTYRGYLLDDAYISLRYAQNLVEGHGLVWTLGERVEGYTNFLWVLLGALFLKLGLNAMAALQTVSALAVLALLVFTGRLAGLASNSPTVPAVVWLLAAESLGYYTTTGMETALFTLLSTLAIYLCLREARERRRLGSVIVFVLLTLTRPEGLMLFGLCQGICALVERHRHGSLGLKRRTADALVYATAIGTWVAWRFAYYGELLPNTYHAKVTGGAEQLTGGLLYLRDWALTYPVLALALLAPALLLTRPKTKKQNPELMAIQILAICWLGYVVAVGGDSMPFHRFLLPLLPLAAVLACAAFSAVLRIWPPLGAGRRPLALAALLLAVQLVAGRLGEEPMRAFVAHRTTLVGLETGRYLANERDSEDLLAVNTAGALPWASRLPSLDMLGLTEPTIARHDVYVVSPRWSGHRRGWGKHVLSRRPAVIVWYNSAGAREPHYLGDHQLAENPYFRFFYQLRRAELPAAGDDGHIVARFRGTPFGNGAGGRMLSPNLGLRFEVRPSPFTHTVARGESITFDYFELRPVHQPLWPLHEATGDDLDRFLDAVIQHWQLDAALFDANARREVEALCAKAYTHVRAGRHDTAKAILSRAAALNGAARSPLVGHYIANLAVTERNLFLAVQAQAEALRLSPGNPLYRSNLKQLLTVPYKDFTDP